MPSGTGAVIVPPAGGVEADALSALVNLGYRRAEALGAVQRVMERSDGAAVGQVIRESLQELAQ